MSTCGSSRPPVVSVAVKCRYGVGALAEGLKNGALSTFLLFFYSQVVGLPASLAGVAIGIALAVDAAVDPVVGSLSDHWRSRWGRRHPFMVAAIAPMMIAFVMLFTPPATGAAAQFIWLLFWVVIVRLSMSMFLIPFLALGAELSSDFSERIRLVGFRMFFSIVGGAAASAIGFQFFFRSTPAFPVGQLDPGAYLPFSSALALIMGAAIAICVSGTRKFIPFMMKPDVQERLSSWSVLKRAAADLAQALRQRKYAWLFSGLMLVFIMIGTTSALGLYLATYFWELSSADLVVLALTYPAGSVIGLLVSPAFQRRFGQRAGLLFGTFSWASLQVLPVVLRLLGAFPENESDLLMPLLGAINVIQGIGGVQANTAIGSAIAEIADEAELRTGQRQEGIYFAANSFAHQLAAGAGGLIAGLSLELISWPTAAEIGAQGAVSADRIFALGVVYGPLTIGFCALTYWCYSHYSLTPEQRAAIQRELAMRRAARGNTSVGEGGVG